MHIDQSGVTICLEGATPGCTLFSPIQSREACLIDRSGEVVHRWAVSGKSTNWCMLLPNGNLWMVEKGTGRHPNRLASGAMREYDWEGNIVWEHLDDAQHHDARRLPNGGCVYPAWERLDDDFAAAVGGGVPGSEPEGGLWGEVVREVDARGDIVWEWRMSRRDAERHPIHRNAERKVHGHCNTVDVLPDGDYLLSFKVLNLLLIVSRKTGEILWEFQDDRLGGQHDAQMTDSGTILVFANGLYASEFSHSQVWEIDRESGEVVWKYQERKNPLNFYSTHLAGCQRLPSGNTLVCEGAKGVLFEATPDCEVVWQYVNPFWNAHPLFDNINWIYRARHYTPESPELAGRLQA